VRVKVALCANSADIKTAIDAAGPFREKMMGMNSYGHFAPFAYPASKFFQDGFIHNSHVCSSLPDRSFADPSSPKNIGHVPAVPEISGTTYQPRGAIA
jgi:hypothetical protein